AAEELPRELSGSAMNAGNTRGIVRPWSVVIDSQHEDGTIAGTLTWSGVDCRLQDASFSGSYREGALHIQVPRSSPKCGILKIDLRRTSDGAPAFDGTSSFQGMSVPMSTYLKSR
ncbi:MAG: hypothetical protein ACMG51_00525, partial [Ginsengibacter sp.]